MKRIFVILPLIAVSTFILLDGISTLPVSAQNSDTRTRVSTPTKTPTPSPSPVTVTPTPSKEDDEVIRIETQLVNLNVRVLDRNNRPINNLDENAFKIFEDGKLQEIDSFNKSEVPTNYALVVDNSGSMRPLLGKVVEAGTILINTNKAEDESMIVRFIGSDKIEIKQGFTSSKEDLNYALENLYIEGGQTAVIDAVYLAVKEIEEHAASRKASDSKRRALILISDGEDRNSHYTEKQLFDLLRESEVQIFVVGFIDELSKDSGLISKSPQAKAKAFLERMTKETGGKPYFPTSTSELPTIARDISNELRTQYAISYIPSNDKRDGTFRTIRVAVDDGPNKEKRIAISRTGRTAEGGTPTPPPPKPAAATSVTKNP